MLTPRAARASAMAGAGGHDVARYPRADAVVTGFAELSVEVLGF